MKKSLTILLTLALTVSMSGCTAIQEIQNYFVNINVFGQPGDETAETSEKQSFWDTEPAETEKLKPTATPTPSPTPTPSGYQTLRVVTNAYFPPFEYLDENNEMVGFDIDVIKFYLGDEQLNLEFENLEFDDLLDEVNNDPNCIAIAGMTENDERKEKANFVPYYENVLWFIVRGDSGISTSEEIVSGDYVVGVAAATTSDIYMTDDIGEERLVRYPNVNAAVEALANGEVDAVLTHREDLNRIKADYPELTSVDCSYSCEQYAIAVNYDATKGGTIMLDKFIQTEFMGIDNYMQMLLAKNGIGSYSATTDPIHNDGDYFYIDESLLGCSENDFIEIFDDIYNDIYYPNWTVMLGGTAADMWPFEILPWTYSDTFDSYMDMYFLGYKYTIFMKDGNVAAIRYEIKNADLNEVVSLYQSVYGDPIHECIDANGNAFPQGNSGYGSIWSTSNGYLSVFENDYDNNQYVAIQYQVNEYQ